MSINKVTLPASHFDRSQVMLTACGAAVVLPSTVHSSRTDVDLAFSNVYKIDSILLFVSKYVRINSGVSAL